MTQTVTEPPFELCVRNTSKTFPGVRALKNVSLSIKAGEVVALVGQNGSGKSTLVKILAEVYSPDPGGEIVFREPDGSEVSGRSLRERLHFIHQDLGLVPGLTALENLAINNRSGKSALLPKPRRDERLTAQRLLSQFGEQVDLDVQVQDLPMAEQTIVAMARALRDWKHSSNVLVLDEPTAALNGAEVDTLFRAVRRVAARGAAVLFISHRLDEVLSIADRVLAFRDGVLVADEPTRSVDQAAVVRMIVGSDVADRVPTINPVGDAEPLLEVDKLNGRLVRDLNLAVRPGEIVGVAGVLGSGREELCSLLFGASRRDSGSVSVQGRRLKDTPRASITAGMVLVPADRRRDGLVLELSARENITLPNLEPLRSLSRRIKASAERSDVDRWIKNVDLRPPLRERPAEIFSGGNQQKMVLAKNLRLAPRILLLDEPTQGVDVGGRAAIYDLIETATRSGAGAVLASSDARELVSVCSRVLVLREGRLAAELVGDDVNEARLVTEMIATEETTECSSASPRAEGDRYELEESTK